MFWIWVGIAAGFVLLSGLALFFHGKRLPDQYEVENKWRYPCPSDRLWDAILDYHNLPLGGKMCRKVEDLPPVEGRPSWREDLGSSSQTVEVLVADRPQRLVIRATDNVVPLHMTFTMTFDLREKATRVTARRVLKIEDGTWHVPIFRLLMHHFKVHEKGQRDYLLALARKLGVESEFS